MGKTVAERIQERLTTLGKNASSVAVEAGLGRSSVRDILIGKASNPRLDTLQKLTVPLDTTIEYLTGADETPSPRLSRGTQFDWQEVREDEIEVVEAGAFREGPDVANVDFKLAPKEHQSKNSERKQLIYSDVRLPGATMRLYRMGDDSLDDLHILKGDLLTVTVASDPIPLKNGAIVLVRRSLRDRNLEELSARQVSIRKDIIALACQSSKKEYKPIHVTEPLADDNFMINWHSSDDNETIIKIEGLVVRVSRDLPINFV